MIRRLFAYWRLHRVPIILLLLSVGCYLVFAYQLEREDSVRLFALYASLFFFCFKLIQFEKWNFKFLFACGLVFRMAFLVAIPNLSQDFYRFIWDGRMILEGINPYLFTPDELFQQAHPAVSRLTELHNGMGPLSARHYSNYPPLNQLIFAIASFIGGKGIFGPILAMRGIMILSDIGILYFGRKLLKKINRSPHLIFWYFLNPLVIIELTGNLHFEGVMLFLLICSLYLLLQSRWFLSGVLFALSVLLKLVPLIFLPLFLSYFGVKKSLKYYLVIGGTCILAIIPFMATNAAANYGETLGLWFSNFEFNAGIYNLIKEIAGFFEIRPWELIKTYGKITAVITITLVLALTALRKNSKPEILLSSMLLALSCYYVLSPTVHPWYIISLVLLCLFTDLRYPLFWSAVVMLSYNAYARPEFNENPWLLFLEYFVVIGMMGYEIVRLNKDYLSINKN